MGKPNADFRAAISYNEKKTVGEKIADKKFEKDLEGIANGKVLATRNVPEGKTLSDEMERLRMNAIKKAKGPHVKNIVLHMSINPSEDDKPLDEKEIVGFIDELMKGMGYENQPYRIYEHNDIKRKHYHVVACRAMENGKKVDDSFEWMRLRKLAVSLEKKYGFSFLLNEKEEKMYADVIDRNPEEKNEKKVKENKKKREKPAYVPPFSKESETPIGEQMHEIAEELTMWHFTTFEQLQQLAIRRYNVLLELEGNRKDNCVMSGLDKGKICIRPLSEEGYKVPLTQTIIDRISNEKMSQKKDQRKRIETLNRAAADVATNYKDYVDKMYKKGVYVVPSFNVNGELFGITFLDRATKCAWKGSDIDTDLKWLKETAEEKGWEITPDKFQNLIDKRNNTPSRISGKNKLNRQVVKDPDKPNENARPVYESKTVNTLKTIGSALKRLRSAGTEAHSTIKDDKRKRSNEDDDENIKYVK